MHDFEMSPLSMDYADLILSWRNSEAVAKFLYSDHRISRDEHLNWISRVAVSQESQYWIIKHQGKPVGLSGVYDKSAHNRRCSWMFYLGNEASRGCGIGSLVEFCVVEYVFYTLKYIKLSCEVFEFNDAVIRLHKAHGFKQECHLKSHIWKGNQWNDVVGLALLEPEWAAIRPEIIERLRRKGMTPPVCAPRMAK